jgi:4'-phosphopantetheinyl transferase
MVREHVAGLPDDARVWRLTIDLAREPGAEVLRVLTPAERLRGERFARRADRARFAVTRAALRDVLGRELGAAPGDVPIRETGLGKPILGMEREAVWFNVSHAGNQALIGLSRVGVIGVDVENKRCDVDIRSLARQVLTAAEASFVSGQPEEAARDAFFACWVCKESLLKAIGVGIGTDLRRFTVLPGHGGGMVMSEVNPGLGIENMRLALVGMPPEYVGAVAYSIGEESLSAAR